MKYNLIHILRRDPEIKKLIKVSKRIGFSYKNFKDEIRSFTVGAAKFKVGASYDFEKAIVLMRKIQAYLDRLVTLNSELNEKDTLLQRLEEEGEAYLNGFDSIAKLRNAEIRRSTINSVLKRINKKRLLIADLQDDIEKFSWNLKHTFTVISGQIDLAKQVLWMRNPERFLSEKKR